MAASGGSGRMAWDFLRRNWPTILQSWNAVNDYLAKNPEASAAVRRQVEEARGRLVSVQRKRTTEAQVVNLLGLVEELADERTGPGASPQQVAEAEEWRRQVLQIRRALQLAETHAGAERKRMLARVKESTSRLATQAFDSLLPDGGVPPNGVPPHGVAGVRGQIER